jgi:hypothetical protein
MKCELIVMLLLLFTTSQGRTDLVEPDHARHASSPDGNLIARIKTTKRAGGSKGLTEHDVSFYKYDSDTNSYTLRTSFHLVANLSQMLYISNFGDLVMITLSEKDAVRLYSKTGKLEKSWDLTEFLTEAEIVACAETGATTQWLEEAEIRDRRFFMKGPSQVIRAVRPPYTIMRGVDSKTTFTASINLETCELTKDVSD